MFKGYCTFLLIDIVDSSNQFDDLHDAERQKRLKGFFEHLENLATQHGFQIIDKPGDAAVLVDQVNDQNGDLLALMMDVYVYKRLKEFALRAVAHHVHLRFEKDAKGLPIYSGKEVVRTFRSEKAALKWELLVSDFLYQSLDEDLDSHKITASGVIKGHDLTGHKEFQSIGEVRRLQFPLKLGKTSYHKHFAKKRTYLWHDVQKIKVFGGLYPDVDMADSFINLSLETSYESHSGRGSLGFHHRLEDRFGMFLGERPENDRQITAIKLLDRFNKGLILGLPGAGKTTMLRNLAFRLLSDDRDRGLILVKCRDLGEPETEFSDHRAIFRYLTIGYMGSKAKSLDTCTQNLLEAWEHKEAVILIDALDEAPSDTIKQAVKAIFETLQREIVAEQRESDEGTSSHDVSNRIFLTSRPVEYLDRSHANYPVFNVNALDSGQITDLARHFLGEQDETFKQFRTDLPKTPYAVMVGSTPLTALLIIVWYQAYKSFELRYATYDLLMKFVLHKTWDLIKDGIFSRYFGTDLKPFLDQVRNNKFEILNPDAFALYKVLSDVSFQSLYGRKSRRRDIGETPLKRFLQRWLDKTKQNKTPEDWIKFLKDHHILVSAGHDRYQFIHSTIMEFLAARDLILKDLLEINLHQTLAKEHESLETLPISCSYQDITAYAILQALRSSQKKRALNLLAYRCLAETEALEHKQIAVLEYEDLEDEEAKRLDYLAGDSKVWVYQQLKYLFEIAESEEIAGWAKELENLVSLCRDTFKKKFLPKDWHENSELLEPRKKLLSAIYDQGRLDVLPTDFQEKSTTIAFVKQKPLATTEIAVALSSQDHPLTQDYRKRVGSALVKIYGIPRISHAGYVRTVAFDPNGDWLASGGQDGAVRLWTLDGMAGPVLRGHKGAVLACAWGAGGLASGGDDGTVRLWGADGTVGPVLRGHKGRVLTCVWGAGGLASGGDDGTVRLWSADGTAGPVLRGHEGPVLACTWGTDGLASGGLDGTVRLWDTDVMADPVLRGHEGRVLACAWGAGGLASGGADGTVRLWDTDVMADPVLRGHEGRVLACAWGAGGLASGGGDGTVRLWGADGTAGPVLRGHAGAVMAYAWGADGTLASGGEDGTVRLWDVANQRELARVELHATVRGLAFDPEGGWRMITANHNTVMTMIDWSKLL